MRGVVVVVVVVAVHVFVSGQTRPLGVEHIERRGHKGGGGGGGGGGAGGGA